MELPGITPAGAGHTSGKEKICPWGRDHPRRCGAYPDLYRVARLGQGSPPQVRGIRESPRALEKSSGITPAGAGHTTNESCRDEDNRDHPRRCGAYVMHHESKGTDLGSPPQVRGIPTLKAYFFYVFGITPAGAGHTIDTVLCCPSIRDHPRRCGAYLDRGDAMGDEEGSPPQVRGIPSGACVSASSLGITPAGAGHTMTLFGM